MLPTEQRSAFVVRQTNDASQYSFFKNFGTTLQFGSYDDVLVCKYKD